MAGGAAPLAGSAQVGRLMPLSRLALALRGGVLTLPEAGRVVALRPPAGQDLSFLPKRRLLVAHGFYPDHAAWAGRGYDTVLRAEGRFAAALVFLPRARALARHLIGRAAALSGGGPVIVDGQKTDGAESVLKACRR